MVITANESAWIQVKDGATMLKRGRLDPDKASKSPPIAKAPVLTTGKPEALRIAVGTADAPPVGPAGDDRTNVSLLGPDLMRGPAAAAPPAAAAEHSACRKTPPNNRIHRRESYRPAVRAHHLWGIMTATCAPDASHLPPLSPSAATPAPASSRVATPEQRIDRLEKQSRQVQRQVFPKGQPADTAGFPDEPAATQSSPRTLDQRLTRSSGNSPKSRGNRKRMVTG